MTLPAAVTAQFNASLRAQNDLIPTNPRLEQALQNTQKHGLPSIEISPPHGQLLSLLCKLVNAKSVLEIGTLGGYSTIWLAESVPGIQVTSIKSHPKHRDVASENVRGLANVDILLGAALDVLPPLHAHGAQFDVIFIDADWENQERYFEWAVRLARKGACVYVDNVGRRIEEVEAEGGSGAMVLIDRVKTDERVVSTLIPTISNYGRGARVTLDGFLLAWVQ